MTVSEFTVKQQWQSDFHHQSPDYRPPALDEDDGYLALLPRRRAMAGV